MQLLEFKHRMMMDDVTPINVTTNNKRPRSTTPQPTKRGSLDLVIGDAIAVPSIHATAITSAEETRAANIRSRDLSKRNNEINELLQISANHDMNYSMQSDSIIQALSESVWKNAPTPRMQAWAKHCSNLQLCAASYKLCEVVAMILRNFSYTGANLRLLAYSPEVLHILIAFIYIGVHDDRCRKSGLEETIPLSAIQTLRHLVSYLDVTGQQLLTDKLFYDGRTLGGGDGPAVPKAANFGKCASGELGGFGACLLAKRLDVREDTTENVSTELLLELTSDYLAAVWSIFPALSEVFVHYKSSRSVVMGALDFIQELINLARIGLVGTVQEEDSDIRPGQDYKIPNLRSVLVHLPDSILDRLTSLLFIPRVGPDSLEYVDPSSQSVLRSNPLKLLSSYNTTVDVEARDRALDILVPLLELDSPRMAARMGNKMPSNDTKRIVRTFLYDALFPILTTNIGRANASLMAVQLFRELAQAEENTEGFLYIQARLVELASRDPRVSQLVWNDLYPIVPEDVDDDETTATP